VEVGQRNQRIRQSKRAIEKLFDQIPRIKRGHEVFVEKEKIFHQQSVLEKVKG
jgi:hypothetical protein